MPCAHQRAEPPTLRASLITAWLEVRVLPGPPRSPMRTDVFRSPTNRPQFAGISAGSNAGRAVSAAGRGRVSVDFGCRSLGSANPFLAPAGVAHEDRQDQIDKPSIAYWRDRCPSPACSGFGQWGRQRGALAIAAATT